MAALFAAAAFDQYAPFSHLATTGDGSQVLFATGFRQRSTDQSLWVMLFRYGPRGFEILVERPCPAPFQYGAVCSIPSARISADGSGITHTGEDCCVGSGQRTCGGQVLLSRNGRWLVSFSSPNLMDFRPAEVANDGSLLFTNGTLLRASGVTEKTTAAGASAMDDAATIAAGETGGRVFVADIPSSHARFIGPGTRDDWQPRLSADGRWLLYLTRLGETPQAMFSRGDGSDWRQLTDFAEGVREAVLSGNGRVAWAVTGHNALVRIDTGSGAIDDVIAPSPVLLKAPVLGPGSLALIEGAGFPAEPTVTLDGRSPPV